MVGRVANFSSFPLINPCTNLFLSVLWNITVKPTEVIKYNARLGTIRVNRSWAKNSQSISRLTWQGICPDRYKQEESKNTDYDPHDSTELLINLGI